MAKARVVKAKRKCCKAGPRCKRCPVVLRRLEAQELAERRSKRTYVLSRKLKPKALKRARARTAAI
ncbi:MAG TPA: hypothetical protein VHF58_03760 [Solirubrobacterales bacterium]|nr:hypothetical protein [Solirubrobacterales bacterium]